MKSTGILTVAMCCLLAGTAVHAQQSAAPAGSTGQCKDLSYTSAATKKGSCRGHKGVKEWYTSAAATTATAAAPTAAAATTAATSADATAAAPVSTTISKKVAPSATTVAAAGGGPGMVWVNTSSKTYHCQGDKWYGKTKHGEYLSEAAAKAQGDHADHGKVCSQ